ncbi:MAG: hypothetical protein M3Q51_02895 [Pseudomonadota bacterium]|nr:hypothetical protein [Pseudomonadota bacterium]MDQ3159952.1 hypothetical protein [Pseudomonadota bacterium]
MDIHDISLSLYTALLGRQDLATATDESRVALGREAYRCAVAFFVAKDAYIRELPVTEVEAGY